jgi:hypothetical protein
MKIRFGGRRLASAPNIINSGFLDGLGFAGPWGERLGLAFGGPWGERLGLGFAGPSDKVTDRR